MDKNNIILYSVLVIGIIIFLFVLKNNNNFFENSYIINKNSENSYIISKNSKNSMINRNSEKSYKNEKELDENYSINSNPQTQTVYDQNLPSIPINNIKPENKIKKFNISKYFNNPDVNNSYSELLSMSNSMINFEKPINIITRDINKNIPNPRYEDFSSIDETLILPDYESKYVNQLDFPENISVMLPKFNADNVAQIYNKDNITDLYNTINTDIYKRYKTYNLV